MAARFVKVETAVAELQSWRAALLPTPPKLSTDRLEARRALHGLIHTYLDAEDLQQLCFDLGIVYADLGEGGHDDKIRELVLMSLKTGGMGRLVERLRAIRPGVEWPDGV